MINIAVCRSECMVLGSDGAVHGKAAEEVSRQLFPDRGASSAEGHSAVVTKMTSHAQHCREGATGNQIKPCLEQQVCA